VIEQVWHDRKKDRNPVLDALIGDRGRQVGFAGSALPHEHEPPLRVFCIPYGVGECASEPLLMRCFGTAAARQQRREALSSQRAKVAEPLQALLPFVLMFGEDADAWNCATKVRVAKLYRTAHEPRA